MLHVVSLISKSMHTSVINGCHIQLIYSSEVFMVHIFKHLIYEEAADWRSLYFDSVPTGMGSHGHPGKFLINPLRSVIKNHTGQFLQ